MKTSQAGQELIAAFEGCILHVYDDAAGFPTIGIGHLIKPGEVFTTITTEEAMELLAKDLEEAEDCVNSTNLDLEQHQFDALVSFVFNLGCNAFKSSTLLRRLKEGELEKTGNEFLRWNKAGGKVLKGLTRRREAERTMFLGERI